uniref:Ankyrin repeat-containing protein n=1 Tax=Oryza sativa subsp. japonica TaxID=39947 RepID=Q9AYD6_ORYSJ|nr:putative ankyrin repeat-containing protein [Oryza sativa Japonica Group]
MDPPPPREAFVKSKFASWLIVRMIEMVNTMGEKDRAKFTDMNIDGNGLLQVAAHLGKIEVIRYFVEELGFDVNAGCLSDGVTALASAAMFGEAYVVRYLLEHGADPNKTDETGSVALHFAAKNGLSLHFVVATWRAIYKPSCYLKYSCLKYHLPFLFLEQAGYDSAFFFSFCLGYEEVVRLLLSSGARTGIVVAHGTPLHIAVFYRRIGVVKILLDHHVDCFQALGNVLVLNSLILTTTYKIVANTWKCREIYGQTTLQEFGVPLFLRLSVLLNMDWMNLILWNV